MKLLEPTPKSVTIHYNTNCKSGYCGGQIISISLFIIVTLFVTVTFFAYIHWIKPFCRNLVVHQYAMRWIYLNSANECKNYWKRRMLNDTIIISDFEYYDIESCCKFDVCF